MNAPRRAVLLTALPLVAALLWMLLFPLLGIAEPYGSLLSELGVPALCFISAYTLYREVRARDRDREGARAKRRYTVIASVAAFAVAVNNFPWRAILLGNARVDAPLPAILLFLLLCLAVAALEEVVFRGILLPVLLSRFGRTTRARLSAILLSSAVFGLFHLLNLTAGASVPATLLQVGYSFLVGCAAAVLFLLSRRLGLAVLFHVVYNFGGMLVPRLGSGSVWDTETVILTAVLGTVAAVLMTFAFFCGEKMKENHPKQEKNEFF